MKKTNITSYFKKLKHSLKHCILRSILWLVAVQMRLTWVSGDKQPQQVQYGGGKSETSQVTTFSQDDMCSKFI